MKIQKLNESLTEATHCVYFTQDGKEQIEFEGSEDECNNYINDIQAEQDDEFGDESPERFIKKLNEDTDFEDDDDEYGEDEEATKYVVRLDGDDVFESDNENDADSYYEDCLYDADYDTTLELIRVDGDDSEQLRCYDPSGDDADRGYDDYIENRFDDRYESLDEASYGGAYDIKDNQYFTREDIESAAEEVMNHILETFKQPFVLGGTWFEDGKFVINVQNEETGDEFESEVAVDMRKIKTPQHLKNVYAMELASELIKKIKEYDGINESLNEDATVIKEGPKEGPEFGLASLLNEAIQEELKTIDTYNSLALTARKEGYEDIAKMIDEINTEENKHVGQLQEALKSISPNAIAIEDGTAEGQEQMSNAVMVDDDLTDEELGITLFKLK